MGLVINISEQEEVRCPHCGEVVSQKEALSVYSSGHIWYAFLKQIGYYSTTEPCGGKQWYAKDMELDAQTAKKLVAFAIDNNAYNYDMIETVIAKALFRENKVVINAEW